MYKKLSPWLYKVTNGWLTLIAIILFLSFTALVLPQQAKKAENLTGTSASPDTSLTYTPNDLYQMAETYGKQGRKAYIQARFTFDLIFPIIYTLFLVIVISWLTDKILTPNNPWRRINLVPIWGAIFDYLENTATSLVMWRYPTQTPIALLAPIFTLIKWLFVGGSFLLLFIEIGIWLWQWGKRKRE